MASPALPPAAGAAAASGDQIIAETAAVLTSPAGKGRGGAPATRKAKKAPKDSCRSSSSSSSSTTTTSTTSSSSARGFRMRNRRYGPSVPRCAITSDDDDGFQDLGLPLGMSFAAILAQVLEGENVSRERMPLDQLSLICTSAVKESLHIIYGERFDCFMRNFEKSFGSTLRTLRIINEASIGERGNGSIGVTFEGQGNANSTSFLSSNCEAPDTLRAPGSLNAVEEFQENWQVNSLNSQIILHGQVNQQLAHVSHSIAGHGSNESILNTIEKSLLEQTRSNDLKAVEISLIMKKLQLKQSQLALSSYANFLDKVKICMGISKASFNEEKLRNQMQDMRYVKLLKTCIDLLVAGIVIMLCFILYGAYIYSYLRIAEATSSCSSIVKEYGSWWVPKQVSSFNSTWLMLKCHVKVLTQMIFGLLMILAIAYLVLLRSAASGPTMPVTFILLLLGAGCGIAGKFSVDALGGSGYCWLLYWETLCFLHFFANIFPSVLYYILYGPVSVSQVARSSIMSYWVRRCTFYSILLLVLPTLSGLLPFASLHDWKEHFTQKVTIWNLANENGA